jgi:uncharacterized protein YecT (DUF1311 family)
MKLVVSLLLIGFSPVICHAQTTTPELKAAAAQEFEKSDKAMNAAYQQLLKILNDEGKKRLREAQRAWVVFRDKQAEFDCHHLAGGTMEGLEYTGSLNLLTQERTKRLKEDYARFKDM